MSEKAITLEHCDKLMSKNPIENKEQNEKKPTIDLQLCKNGKDNE